MSKSTRWCVWILLSYADTDQWNLIATFEPNDWASPHALARQRFLEIGIDEDFRLLPEGKEPKPKRLSVRKSDGG